MQNSKPEENSIFNHIIDEKKMQYITLDVLFKGDDVKTPLALAIPYIFDEDDLKEGLTKVIGIEITTAQDIPTGVNFGPDTSAEYEEEASKDTYDLEEVIDSLAKEMEDIANETIKEGLPKDSEIQDS